MNYIISWCTYPLAKQTITLQQKNNKTKQMGLPMPKTLQKIYLESSHSISEFYLVHKQEQKKGT